MTMFMLHCPILLMSMSAHQPVRYAKFEKNLGKMTKFANPIKFHSFNFKIIQIFNMSFEGKKDRENIKFML